MQTTISQNDILTGIVFYLQNKKKKNPQEVSDEWIAKFKWALGYCCGFASVWLSCCKISESPSKLGGEPRDDAAWFKKNIDLLSSYYKCHGKMALTSDQEKDLDRFINHIEFFQSPSQYLVTTEQASLDKSLEYTVTPTVTTVVNLASSSDAKASEGGQANSRPTCYR
jgi:hypothetical protein